MSEPPVPPTSLPDADRIRTHYNSVVGQLDGAYLEHRWFASPIQRSHYRQTGRALRHLLANSAAGGSVLEIGCGPAVWTPLVLARAERVVLSDVSDAMLDRARTRIAELDGGRHAGKVTYHRGDFVNEPVTETEFDLVVSVRAFEYMSDKVAFLANCRAALRPGGMLLIVTKNREWGDWPNGRGGTREASEIGMAVAMQSDLVSVGQLEGMMERSGFLEVRSYPVVYGSYRRPYRWWPARVLLEGLQSVLHRWRWIGGFSALAESFATIAQRDGSGVA